MKVGNVRKADGRILNSGRFWALGSVVAGYWKLDSGLESHLRGRNISLALSSKAVITSIPRKRNPTVIARGMC
jgi:hypothetical protein